MNRHACNAWLHRFIACSTLLIRDKVGSPVWLLRSHGPYSGSEGVQPTRGICSRAAGSKARLSASP